MNAMYTLGVRRLVVVGLAPFGCTPLIKTLRDDTKCDATFNSVALSFNSKLKARLAILKKSLGMKAAYIDVYNMVDKAIQNPQKYGFSETSKGCCGTGTIEYAGSCKGLSTCADRTKYLFWDAAHFTEKMYKIIADEALTSVIEMGLAPFGCTPLIKTLRDDTKCDATFNSVALSFNSKLKARLAILKKSLGMKAAYIDVYNMVDKTIQNPQKYGFSETSKGCCGTGTIEYAGSCKGLSTCADRTKYLFWDAAHFTEKMYKIIADEALTSVIESLLN
ncbi:unnamed protein product [Ilex paraguariensis]|uniref:GDSL esterase/lipase n=1 Tax=Ilex paraguariensis TaxID=185542 RepID=A0ABC8QPR1_9AQUA